MPRGGGRRVGERSTLTLGSPACNPRPALRSVSAPQQVVTAGADGVGDVVAVAVGGGGGGTANAAGVAGAGTAGAVVPVLVLRSTVTGAFPLSRMYSREYQLSYVIRVILFVLRCLSCRVVSTRPSFAELVGSDSGSSWTQTHSPSWWHCVRQQWRWRSQKTEDVLLSNLREIVLWVLCANARNRTALLVVHLAWCVHSAIYTRNRQRKWQYDRGAFGYDASCELQQPCQQHAAREL